MLRSKFSRLSSLKSIKKMATRAESLSDYLLQVNTFIHTFLTRQHSDLNGPIVKQNLQLVDNAMHYFRDQI